MSNSTTPIPTRPGRPSLRPATGSAALALLLAATGCGNWAWDRADYVVNRPAGTPPAMEAISGPASLTAGQGAYRASIPPQAGATYAWTVTNGTATSGAGTPSLTFTAGAVGDLGLTCTVTNAAGSVQDTLAIPVHHGPVISAPLVSELQQGVDTASTAAQPGFSYHWDLTGGQILQGRETATVTFLNVPASSAPALRNAAVSTPGQLVLELTATEDATGAAESTTLVIPEVEDDAEAPAGLTYAPGSATFTVGVAIPEILNDSTGGSVASYAVAPALPKGLVLDPVTGFIQGTPLERSPLTTYTVTATNALGSTTATLDLTVMDAAPAHLAYPSPVPAFVRGTAITPLAPSSDGGPVAAYSIQPALPQGLALDTGTGILSGTPLVTSPPVTYIVIATNATGSTTATLDLVVMDAAPAHLAYPGPVPAFVRGTVITPLIPSSDGGTVTAYAINPPLPQGLALDAVTGVISGTPLVIAPSSIYTVTASNATASATAQVTLQVNDIPPSNLAYPQSFLTLNKNTPITPMAPTSGGGAVTGFTVAPALPAGLTLDPGTGQVSGTPTTITAQGNYLVTARNSGGTTTAYLVIKVLEALPVVAYAPAAMVFTAETAVSPILPSSTGGPITGFTILPALSQGLVFDTATGSIQGTPPAILPKQFYSVWAAGPGGTVMTTFSIQVVARPPAFSYQPSTAVLTQFAPMTPLAPISTGGAIGTYRIGPEGLPPGLDINHTTGVISGTPLGFSSQASYTILGVNTGGQASATITLTVLPQATQILQQPTGASALVGTSVTFTVAAAGPPTGSLAYQWQKDGTDISGATGTSYTRNNLTLADAGAYRVVVTDSFGRSVSSAGAVLTVTRPVARYAFVGNTTDGTVSGFTVDAASGSLRHNGYVPAGPATGISGTPSIHVVAEPTGQLLFKADRKLGTLTTYRIGNPDGSLTVIGQPVPMGGEVRALALSPDGTCLFVACQTGSLTVIFPYHIDTAGGNLSGIGSSSLILSGAAVSAMAMEPSGRFLYAADDRNALIQAIAFNATTGDLTPVGTLSAGAQPTALAANPAGTALYATDAATGNLNAFAINGTTGALTSLVSLPGQGDAPGAIAVDPGGQFLYVACAGIPNVTSGFLRTYTLDASGVPGASPTAMATGQGACDLVFDPTAGFLYSVEPGTGEVAVFQRSAGSAVLTEVGRIRGRAGLASIALVQGSSPLTRAPRFAYSANGQSATVSGFQADAVTGVLAPLAGAPAATGTGPSAVAVDPGARFAYVTNTGDGTISPFTVGSDGTLTSSGSAVATATFPTELAIDPSGRFAVLVNGGDANVASYAIDPGTGALTALNTQVGPGANGHLALDPTGRFAFVVANGHVAPLLLDPSTGNLTAQAPSMAASVGANASGIAVAPSGRYLYVSTLSQGGAGLDAVSWYAIDPTTGALASVGQTPSGDGTWSVAADPLGRFVFTPGYGTGSTGSLSVFTVGSGGASLTAGPTVAGIANGSTAMTVDPSGRYVYVVNTAAGKVSTYAIDGTTGALTLTGSPAATGQNPGPLVVTGVIQ